MSSDSPCGVPASDGVWRLPSSRSAAVQHHAGNDHDDTAWCQIELGGGVSLWLQGREEAGDDWSEHVAPLPHPVEASLFWPPDWALLARLGHCAPDSLIHGFPYGYEASVALDDDGLVLALAPGHPHHPDCCPELFEPATQWRVLMAAEEVEAYVDLLSGLARMRRVDLTAPFGGPPTGYWRGRRDGSGNAVVEAMYWPNHPVDAAPRFDSRAADYAFPVVAVVATQLPEPPPALAVLVAADVPLLRF